MHSEVRSYLEQLARVRAPDAPGTVWSADRVLAEAEACTRHGVWLSILPDMLIAPTAELALGLTLALLRNIRHGDDIVRSGRFAGVASQLYGASLHGATVGIAGMGQLGGAVAELLSPFGVARLLYCDARGLEPADEARLRAERVDLAALMARSDVVLLLLPLTGTTRHLIGEDALFHVRPGTYLVNVGRGSVVDEHAVLHALHTGQLAGYAADVFEMEDWALPGRPEQIPASLRSHPHTVFTPHLGSAVDSVRRDMSLTAAHQVKQVFAGRRPDHAVNSPDLTQPTTP